MSRAAIQSFSSLANRDIEDEHVPLAAEFGLGILPWSPLAFGMLSGKYDRTAAESSTPRAAGLPTSAGQAGEQRPAEDKRLDGANPFGDSLFTDKNWQIVDALKAIAKQVNESPARVALAWVASRPGVTVTLMGVSKTAQLIDNMAALEFVLSDAQRLALDVVSAPPPRMLYSLFSPTLRQQAVFGGSSVSAWRP